MFKKQKIQPVYENPMELAVSLIGNKWKLLILRQLLSRDLPWHVSELVKSIRGIDQTVLKVSLQALEKDGLIKSTVYRDLPPRIEFSISEEGRSLRPVIDAIEAWGSSRMPAQAASQQP